MTVLTAIDGERVPSQAVTTGHELADQFDDDHVVIHVMHKETFDKCRDATTDQVPTSFPSLGPGISYGDQDNQSETPESSAEPSTYSIQDGERDAASVARDVVDGTVDEFANVALQGRVGEPVKEILNEAERRDARYLVIGGRKRTPVGKAVFGSVTQSLLLNAELPVMTVMH